ncbi:CpaD family pilus assembly protein [Xanthobacter sp. TB0139]|uniref:CpaD family pilus assembly protein n=1 Tax=Xanthobacter sp. TB0139 TaxID=3459178 RepID=UPI004039D983
MNSLLRHCMFACVGVSALGLAGCKTSEPWTEPPYPTSYKERHPIELTDETTTLEVFPRWAYGLEPRQRADVTAFGQVYRRSAKSKLLINVPVPQQALAYGKGPSGQSAGHAMEPAVRATLESVRKTLIRAGVERRNIMVSYYPASYSAAPLTLSYDSFGARVANECGQWPEDLATGGDPQGYWNESYWNFGCATQSNLAQQVADPVDLVRPRVSSPPDTVRAVDDIRALRTGKDPASSYNAAESIADQVEN